jgi:hypothetical protein
MAIESNTLDNDTDQTAAGLYEYARGDLISVGGGIAVVLKLKENQGFVKAVTIRKDGKRDIAHWLIEAIGGPQRGRLASLISFYDRCAEFSDGAKIGDGDPEIEALIQAARPKAFDILDTTATAVRKFDAATNYSRARVLLDFAERNAAGPAEIEQCRTNFRAAKETSRAHLDLDRYYRRLREAGYNPTVTGFDGRVGINMSVVGISNDRPFELDEVEAVDIDFELRSEYIRAAWEAKPASPVHCVRLGV